MKIVIAILIAFCLRVCAQEFPLSVMASNASGGLIIPTNFFQANVIPGSNIVLQFGSDGKITVNSSGGSGGGTNGLNGTNGINGTNGLNGAAGATGPAGTNGLNGTNGTNGLNGTNGINGTNGVNGTNGISGTNGLNGTNGINGTNGLNGANGTNNGPYISCRMHTAAPITIADSTLTAVVWTQKDFDPDGMNSVDLTEAHNERFSCRTAGLFLLQAGATFAARSTGYREVSWRLNGTTLLAKANEVSPIGTVDVSIGVHTVWPLTTNDYVEVVVYQNSGLGLDLKDSDWLTWGATTLIK